jgi:hypothetical protein
MSAHDAIKYTLIAVATLNLVVSIAVASSAAYSGRQKIIQLLIIWVVAVIGSVLFGLFMLTQRGNAPPTSYPSGRNEDIGQVWLGLHPLDQNL